jgi:two-component system phosphate regulon sensor histidine kinase PhoR
MSKSKKKARPYFQIGFRIAVYTSIISAILVFVLLYFVAGTDLSTDLFYSGIALLTIFVLVYITETRIQQRRLRVLNNIIKNIARKRFQEYEDITTPYNDEVDYLVRQSVRASQMVEKEIQRLNQIENYRKEFIGDISHELKTPIFAIQGFIETLLNGAINDPEVNEDFLKKAMRNVNRLIFLTKDLMEISRLETGEMKSNIDEIYLHDVITDVIESLGYKAQRDNVELVLEDFDRTLQVYADRNQIKQVLINLIENGIKYNKQGGKVHVSVANYLKNESKVLVKVQDTGIGIDEKDIERVTERFFRVDKSRSREKGGTGLGLSIVKHIMEAHNEHFYVESKLNEGSVFSFTLRKVEIVNE